MRKHAVLVAVLEVLVLGAALGHSGQWYDSRPLLAVAVLLGILAAPWTLTVPFLIAGDLSNAALLVVMLGAMLNVWLRYLGYKHGLADSRESRSWRSGRPRPDLHR